jgi:NAD(P)-dependent dehydrogenase (short-subunit alcohol dehydrogenase family)
MEVTMPVALITGASRGFGSALAAALARHGWTLIVDGRDAAALSAAMRGLGRITAVTAIPGDVVDAAHRDELTRAVRAAGRLDLLVNNASDLGPTPLPPLARYPVGELDRVFRVNAVAPLAIIQAVLPEVRAVAGVVVDISSDAAVEAYPGWGGYGASKAALDRLTAVIAAEEPSVTFYAFDPGDMRTAMHQAAYPGEDISDRPLPETVVPALLHLIEERPPSGRYRASDLLLATGPAA